MGIPIDAITPQNEPGAPSAVPRAEPVSGDEVQFITEYLEPALRAAGLDTKIYGLDRGALLYYAKSLALGLRLAHDLAGIAWHCYGGPSYMDVLHTLAPTLDQIVSECSPGIIPYTAAEALISSLRNWASAAALWNLALDPSGGPVQRPNLGCPRLHRRRHDQRADAHRVLRPQLLPARADRASSCSQAPCGSPLTRWSPTSDDPTGPYGVTPGLDDVAFRNPDGTTVLVTYNNSDAWIRFAVTARGRWFQPRFRRGR